MRCEIKLFRAWSSLVLRTSKEGDCTAALGNHHVYVELAEKGLLQHKMGLYFCPKLKMYFAAPSLKGCIYLDCDLWHGLKIDVHFQVNHSSLEFSGTSAMKSLFEMIAISPSEQPSDFKCPLPKMSVFPRKKKKCFAKKNSKCHWEIFPINIQYNFMGLFFHDKLGL